MSDKQPTTYNWHGVPGKVITMFGDMERRLPASHKNRTPLAHMKYLLRNNCGIHPVGLNYGGEHTDDDASIVKWLKEFTINQAVTGLAPPALSRSWNGERRDLSVSSSERPTLTRLRQQHNMCVQIENYDITLKLLIAELSSDISFGFKKPNDNRTSRYAGADVVSAARFVICLPPLLGHRDFIRVITENPSLFHVHEPDSFIIGPPANISEHVSEHVSHCRAQVPWRPYPGQRTTHMVTYVVIPQGDINNTHFHSETDVGDDGGRELDGVFMDCTIDIGVGRDCSKNKTFFEYVRPDSPFPQFRQFFLTFHSAVILPASVAVRFKSHPSLHTHILCFVHSYHSDEEVTSAAVFNETAATDDFTPNTHPTNAMTEELLPVVVQTIPYPFSSDVLHANKLHMQLDKSRPSSGRHHHRDSYTVTDEPITIGCIPVLKAVDTVELRLHILDETRNRNEGLGNTEWDHSSLGIPTIIRNPFHRMQSGQLLQFKDMFISTDAVRSVTTLPVQNIAEFLSFHSKSVYTFRTSDLQRYPYHEQDGFIS